MNIPAQSLKRFLGSAKSHLQNAITHGGEVNLVIGNESADLDSINCALVYSYLHPTSRRNSTFGPYIPIVNIPRADISIRPELLKLLPYANLEPSDLIAVDENSFEISKLLPENTRWILVDHNVLQGELGEKYGHRVVGCIDHHKDEGKLQPDTKADEPCIIKNAGSCTSLVINYLRHRVESSTSSETPNSNAGNQEEWTRISKVALCSIIIDTQNLTSTHKTTDDDLSAVEFLEGKIRQGESKFDRHKFYEEINNAKSSLEDLSLNDILRKDYKQWEADGKTLGVSSVVRSLSFLMEQAGKEREQSEDKAQYFTRTMDKFSKDRNLDVLAIMAASTNSSGNFQRELLVSIQNPAINQFLATFEQEAQSELQLQTLQDTAVDVQNEHTRTWQQGNSEKSRKQVGPLLRSTLEK